MENLTDENRILAERLARRWETRGVGNDALACLNEYRRVIHELMTSFLFPYLKPEDKALVAEMLFFRSKIGGLRKVMENAASPEEKVHISARLREYQSVYVELRGRIEQRGITADMTPTQRQILEHAASETLAGSDLMNIDEHQPGLESVLFDHHGGEGKHVRLE